MSRFLWLAACAGLFYAGLGTARGVTYYVDAAHGSDAADGKAAAPAGASGPWKTLPEVNATTFSPGDKILFASGQRWTGQLHPLGSGVAGNPIMVDVYGAGGKPLIAAAGTADAAVRLFNQSYWEIKNLEVTNTAATPGDLRGISVEGCDAGVLSHIYIEDCYVHDVTGEAKYFGSASATYEIGKRTGGIVFWTDSQTGARTKFDDVLLRGNKITNNAFGAVVFKQTSKYHWAMREGGANDPAWYPHTNVRIDENEINQAGSPNDLVGILLTAVRDVSIRGNRIEHAHQCGIELDYAENCLVEKNDVEHTTKGSTGQDSCALDFDRCCDRTTWQRNFLDDNGVGILSCHGIHTWDFGSDNRVEYNVIQNCREKGVLLVSRGGPDYINNNVFYNDKYKDVPMIDTHGKSSPTVVADNIFYQVAPGGRFSENTAVRYDANCYWGSLKAPKSDVHAVNADPHLVDPGKGGVRPDREGLDVEHLAGYQLQAGSPCVGAGVSVPGSTAKFDLWGHPLRVGDPSIGADGQ